MSCVQIRVHLAHAGHGILGDKVYGLQGSMQSNVASALLGRVSHCCLAL